LASEQVRGQLTEADKGYVPPSVGGDATSNIPANATDTRVVCGNPECDNQTGWNKAGFADYTRFCWDRDNEKGSGL
jgi:hypothetical protein